MFKSMKRIIRWAVKYRGRLYLGSVFSFFSSLSTAIPTMAAAYALDKSIQAYWAHTTIDASLIWKMLWIIVGSIALNFLFSYLRAILQESIGYEVAAGQRIHLGDVLKRVPLGSTLVRGKVEVAVGDKTQVLQPDQQLAVEAGRFTLKQVVAEDYIGWTNGLFHFTEASLEEIMTKLARWYDVEFFFAKPDLKEAHFSLDIQRYENIATILSKLEKTGRARFRVSGKTVVIEQ